MKRKNWLPALSLIVVFMLFTTTGYASVGIKVDGVKKGATEYINFVRGSSTAAQSGNAFNIPVAEDGLVVAGAANGAGTSLVTSTNAIPLTAIYQNIEIDDDPLYNLKTLANGDDGQILILHVYNNPGATTLTVTPVTSYGWSVATFNAIDDHLALLYQDDTSGWIVLNSTSITLTP